MSQPDPFHEGERSVQERTGARVAALRTGALLGDAIPPRAIPFLAEQRMLAIGSVDERGTVSASLLFGAPGLAGSPEGRSVIIDRTRVEVIRDDPLWRNLRIDAHLGLLAIDFASRRRLRINGVVSRLDDRQIDVSVREAYPNCPKYIQRRQLRESPRARPADSEAYASGVSLDPLRSQVVERAGTLFVASRHPTRGVDVSHRGGVPGFVRVLDAGRLRIPDYPGNSMFNTLGNFVVDDRAGLIVLDFDRGSLLQMTGTASIRLAQAEDPLQPTGGSGRYWDFHIAGWLELPVVTPQWELLDDSPHEPGR